jgi:hypothetical protein
VGADPAVSLITRSCSLRPLGRNRRRLEPGENRVDD